MSGRRTYGISRGGPDESPCCGKEIKVDGNGRPYCPKCRRPIATGN